MLEIKQLNNSQFSSLLDALRREDWYIEKVALESLFDIFSDDFFIAYKNNSIVGFIVALRYTEKFGFISNFVILKKFRSKGYGKILFEHALAHLNTRQIALDVDKKQENFYKKYDFKTYYINSYYKHFIKIRIKDSTFKQTGITDKLQKKDIQAYTEKIISKKYAHYIQKVLDDKNTLFRALYKNKTLLAYAFCTQYKDGYKCIVSASTYEEVSILYFHLCNAIKLNTHIYIEVTSLESNVLKLVDLLKMKEVSQRKRMYNKIL
ncbi:MAG: GNAT family N-acetyltransferase [Sulfurimonas sp.]|nr:GNAT family N-acetyltransferase [Sulfurimonas sp.]PHQ91413.1 MAG: hypothetical protein COB42_03625 [Sulfurimonas sp.]